MYAKESQWDAFLFPLPQHISQGNGPFFFTATLQTHCKSYINNLQRLKLVPVRLMKTSKKRHQSHNEASATIRMQLQTPCRLRSNTFMGLFHISCTLAAVRWVIFYNYFISPSLLLYCTALFKGYRTYPEGELQVFSSPHLHAHVVCAQVFKVGLAHSK